MTIAEDRLFAQKYILNFCTSSERLDLKEHNKMYVIADIELLSFKTIENRSLSLKQKKFCQIRVKVFKGL